MNTRENQNFITSFDSLPASIPTHVDRTERPSRVVLRTNRGTLYLYAAEPSLADERRAYRALGTLDTLKERSTKIEPWFVVQSDEPGNPNWSVCSVARMTEEDGATAERVVGWSLEEWRTLGGLRDPDTGDLLVGWLDSDPMSRGAA